VLVLLQQDDEQQEDDTEQGGGIAGILLSLPSPTAFCFYERDLANNLAPPYALYPSILSAKSAAFPVFTAPLSCNA
jgi:hypothetical protein